MDHGGHTASGGNLDAHLRTRRPSLPSDAPRPARPPAEDRSRRIARRSPSRPPRPRARLPSPSIAVPPRTTMSPCGQKHTGSGDIPVSSEKNSVAPAASDVRPGISFATRRTGSPASSSATPVVRPETPPPGFVHKNEQQMFMTWGGRRVWHCSIARRSEQAGRSALGSFLRIVHIHGLRNGWQPDQGALKGSPVGPERVIGVRRERVVGEDALRHAARRGNRQAGLVRN